MSLTIPLEVLVVEDEPLARMVAADALADGGIMASEAADALHVLDEPIDMPLRRLFAAPGN